MGSVDMCTRWAALVGVLLLLVAMQRDIVAEEFEVPNEQLQGDPSPLIWLKQRVSRMAHSSPNLFDRTDLENFYNDRGAIGAARFLQQRSDKPTRAVKLAHKVLKWRKKFGVSQLEAGHFPCDLFKMGLIFESGRAHKRSNETGKFVATTPVIWVRLGALGSIVKQMERPTPKRVVSFAYNTPRNMFNSLKEGYRSSRERHNYMSYRSEQRAHKRDPEGGLIKDLSVGKNKSMQHVLKSIIWWLDDWVRENPGRHATLVLDFENTDFAFSSWSIGDFFIKLDDRFPDLFERIIGYRYRARARSYSSYRSMLNRVFMSRVASSPETDAKLKFVKKESDIGEYLPRVDTEGYTLLPEHVSGTCVRPDEQKAPANCGTRVMNTQLNDPDIWRAIRNEFYYLCKPKSRAD